MRSQPLQTVNGAPIVNAPLETARGTGVVRPKIFCIGPNKTGTTTIHHFFKGNGIQSVHFGGDRRSKNLAQIFVRNVSAAKPILTGVEQYDAFSDVTFVSSKIYLDMALFIDRISAEYPDAYYIYNYRPTEGWIDSRKKHYGGAFWRRYSNCYHFSQDDAVREWRAYAETRRTRDVEMLRAAGRRVIEFELGKDDPQAIVDFLSPHYDTSLDFWQRHNVGATLTLRQRFYRFRARWIW